MSTKTFLDTLMPGAPKEVRERLVTSDETTDALSASLPAQPAGEPNGFEDRSNAVLSFDNGTRTLTITGTYTVWSDGKRFNKSGDTFQIEDREGAHFIYYDEAGQLTETDSFDVDLITRFAFVAYVSWDAANQVPVPGVICEQHGSSMASATHSYLHNTVGTKYQSGMSFSVPSVASSGNDDADAQIVCTAGVMWDEDIRHSVVAHGQTDNIPVIYKDGADGNWRVDASTSFPVLTTGTGRAAYNQNTGGTAWTQTEVANNDYVLAHIYAFPGITPSAGYFVAVQGQGDYATLGAARDGADTELASLDLSGLPSVEFVPVATIILQTGDGKSNAVKSSIERTASGDDFVSWL